MQVDCLSMGLVWFRQVAKKSLEINPALPLPPLQQPQHSACCQVTAAGPLPFSWLCLKQGLNTLSYTSALHSSLNQLISGCGRDLPCQWVWDNCDRDFMSHLCFPISFSRTGNNSIAVLSGCSWHSILILVVISQRKGWGMWTTDLSVSFLYALVLVPDILCTSYSVLRNENITNYCKL